MSLFVYLGVLTVTTNVSTLPIGLAPELELVYLRQGVSFLANASRKTSVDNNLIVCLQCPVQYLLGVTY
uniref:Putative secreted protein n=1 Tax=Ixodes scapularis TaxID=6945 RepID=A0A4D5RD26_IXOSC